jgi:hypothetical protein
LNYVVREKQEKVSLSLSLCTFSLSLFLTPLTTLILDNRQLAALDVLQSLYEQTAKEKSSHTEEGKEKEVVEMERHVSRKSMWDLFSFLSVCRELLVGTDGAC